ncbi:DUF1499 domain-containing protein [Leptospira congkakensis]|uniref:DUF1499 domain-containing protein n=1 Tax=Leptospira congkakensis TaxID=2484932 RepID=A0A4Z1A7M9_9LEPT|nr:DUF1499 domain-containing protein [Leptospira congkakensis]TGL90934.1 DUF1499 domain-containing protein [Leptospira congkakensis]TGL91943.1 DUF1499 domain-containing protein [Leptospira congkakensis]TGL98994.1 DUF1499 domain-containing protein [Leptospira congkakensis]
MNYKIAAISAITVLYFLSGCTGTRPDYLGIKSEKLANCPTTPNCVSSFADPTDKEHYRSSVPYKKSLTDAQAILKGKLEQSPRTKLIHVNSNYIYAEFTSLIMRYVDDVEFYFDEKNKLLHFRSASRLGKSDFGVNRKRIESVLKDLEI